jgi:ParB family transcriptional regulator, chromosome partitioning protein
MGKRTSLASIANEKVEDVPGQSRPTLVRLRPEQIAATPLNPRQNFGTDEELVALGESMRARQLQPVVVVSRAGYLKLWPEHEYQLGEAEFVLANGERRFRASRLVSLDALEAMHREEVAESRAAFLDAVLSENLDRKNFDPIEEAHAVEAMVQECGTATAAAEQFRRHKTWVSQRRALLKLTQDLQDKVRSGELPVRIARSIATVPAEQQADAWTDTRAREAEAVRERAQMKATPVQPSPEVSQPRPGSAPGQQAEEFTAVNTGDSGTGTAEVFTAVNTGEIRQRPAGDSGGDVSDGTQEGGPKVFTAVNTSPRGEESPMPAAEGPRWDSVEWLAAMIRQRLPAEEIPRLVALLTTDAEQARESA